jgi:hypothetical protein
MSRGAVNRKPAPYSYTELLYRPLEHVLEALSPEEIALATGVSQHRAHQLRRGSCGLTIPQEQAMRSYVEGLS